MDSETLYLLAQQSFINQGLNSLQSYIPNPQTITASTPTSINYSAITITPGTWFIDAHCVATDAVTGNNIVNYWIGTNSGTTTGALAGAEARIGSPWTFIANLRITHIVTVTANTTIYCGIECTDPLTVECYNSYNSVGNITGIHAIQLV